MVPGHSVQPRRQKQSPPPQHLKSSAPWHAGIGLPVVVLVLLVDAVCDPVVDEALPVEVSD